MSAQAGFALRGRNPDVLTCIANLSNDEVFTPPELANRMLDTLAKAWAAANRWAWPMTLGAICMPAFGPAQRIRGWTSAQRWVPRGPSA